MSDSERDDEFEAYLKSRAPIDERLRSRERLEPSAELDRIVIGNARKAIQGASPVHPYHAPKWAFPVSLAAILLVSFAILLDLGIRARRREVMAQAPPVPQAMVADKSAAPPPASAAPVSVPPIATNPWPPGSPGVPSPADEPARARFAHAEVAAKRSRIDTYTEPAPAALAEITSTTEHNAPGSAVVSAARRTQSEALAAEFGNPWTEASPPSISIDLSSALASAASSARAAIEGGPDPAAWLEEIQKIRSRGHVAQADREIKRFQKTYPDYPMPAAPSDR